MSNTKESIMRELLAKEYNGKPTWEYIRDNEYTGSLGFKGELYENTPFKIMYVGHAFNGWKKLGDDGKCSSLDATLKAVRCQSSEEALDAIVNENGSKYIRKNGKEGTYYHINSKFWRLIKELLQLLNMSDIPENDGEITCKEWYHDTKRWSQRIVWSNLYCIAPQNGGNPRYCFLRNSMDQYTELMKLQIEEYRPDLVIFCPLSAYFTLWEKTFACILKDYKEVKDNKTILGKGFIGDTQIIVIRRPDRIGNSYEDVREMAKEIFVYIESVFPKSKYGAGVTIE